MRSLPFSRLAILIGLILVQLACAISGAAEEPTPAPIIVVVPGDTSTPLPTIPPTARPTITPIPLFTAGPTFTPTPDLRLIQGEPEDFQLTLADLDPTTGYRLLSQGSSVDQADRSEEWKEEYRENVGETDFYATRMERDPDDLWLPDLINCSVGKFESVPYASVFLNEYNVMKDVDRARGIYLPASEEFPGLGDARLASYVDYEYEGNTETYYVIMATYHNFAIECWGGGVKEKVWPEYIADLVEIIIDKMKAAPLVPPPSRD